LFNSYVFVQLDEVDRYKVFDVPGVVRYVHWLKKPAIVRENEIQSLKELTETKSMALPVKDSKDSSKEK
ncbi:MAG: hypothetical protein RL349_565, partial [Bacteroidota bacterium]